MSNGLGRKCKELVLAEFEVKSCIYLKELRTTVKRKIAVLRYEPGTKGVTSNCRSGM
jgi:hypothetical protein